VLAARAELQKTTSPGFFDLSTTTNGPQIDLIILQTKATTMPRSTAEARHYKVRSSPERLQPPAGLTSAERKIFIELVSNNRPEHFQPSDLPLLVAYTHAIALEQSLAKKISSDSPTLMRWERACKVLTALSHRLRLSPQSRSIRSGARANSPNGRAAAAISYIDKMKLENGHDDQHDDDQ
jgi:hypothetical protein